MIPKTSNKTFILKSYRQKTAIILYYFGFSKIPPNHVLCFPADEHLLPSIGHAVPSPTVSDFIPGDQPSCSSGSGGHGHGMQIGPALPPDLLIPSGSGNGGNEEPKGFANVDGILFHFFIKN